MWLLKLSTFFLFIIAGAHCANLLTWMPCMFRDYIVLIDNEGARDVQLLQRPSILQFGKLGDNPVNPRAVTFLVIDSKPNLQRHVGDIEVDLVNCDIHRFNTDSVHLKWPGQKSNEYNSWFTITLTHSKGLFTISAILRHPSEPPPSEQQDVSNWPPIEDTQTLNTKVAMIMKTQTPMVTSGLGFQKKLHCQFAIDHKRPNVNVQWYQQYHGERRNLFSHASHSGQSEGRGVELINLAGGDLSYTLPYTEVKHAGTYVCSVSVLPLSSSLDISLQIQESPRVSINVGPKLTLLDGEMEKVVCEAENYYPLDVHIAWHVQDLASSSQRVGAPLPKELDNILLSSHKNNMDKTYSLSAFFYLEASHRHSGRQFMCTVSHQSLRIPIKKSFILIVEEPSSWLFTLTVCSILVLLLYVLYVMLRHLYQARKYSLQFVSVLCRKSHTDCTS
ncbi:tapasin-related protein isoform X1 [Syngnathus scovelli]|uniref:tapasin-related protein isoform X1 n=2 Tax=Syngnathus scovelli TaxID=161590 RepID=UPI00211062FD|nr:tapasin-related protein isoform X1 [Syngnathus scovelli]